MGAVMHVGDVGVTAIPSGATVNLLIDVLSELCLFMGGPILVPRSLSHGMVASAATILP
jgi:hypothetical protein